jgi:hypothetical protein
VLLLCVQDVFHVDLPDLGELAAVEVGHDNSGAAPGLQLSGDCCLLLHTRVAAMRCHIERHLVSYAACIAIPSATFHGLCLALA